MVPDTVSGELLARTEIPGGGAVGGIPNAILSPPQLVQELCESRGGRPGLSVLTSLLVSVDVKLY